MKSFWIFTILTTALLSAWFTETKAQANQPQFLISWKANTYAPPDFMGKVLPTANSLITTSFELVDGGKLADLSRQTIYWYLNDDLIENKTGVQQVTFPAPSIAGGNVNLRVELPNYRGNDLLKTIEIPIARPEAVIEAPLPNGLFSGDRIQLKARPYFFNVKNSLDLTFSWETNGETPQTSEEPEVLNVVLNKDASAGTPITIDLAIRNPVNIFESATKSINLTFVK
jgi:hypothetical protein